MIIRYQHKYGKMEVNMKNIFYEKTVSLNEIFMELYTEKNKISKGEVEIKDNPYKSFVAENTEKLKDIFKAMRFDIESYKNENGTYDIPIVVAEVFKVYLTDKSPKGSFISRIKSKKFLEITIEEKKDFINKVIKQLRKKFDGYPNVEDEISDICERWIGEIEYNEKVKNKIIEAVSISNLLIEAAVTNVGAISEIDGLVAVNNHTFDSIQEDKSVDFFKKINEVKVPYNIRLSENDRLELIEYLTTSIVESIKDWKRIVNIACELREENILEHGIDNTNFINSSELVKMSIKEYEESIKANMKWKQVPKHTEEEAKEILKSIKLEMESKKND